MLKFGLLLATSKVIRLKASNLSLRQTDLLTYRVVCEAKNIENIDLKKTNACQEWAKYSSLNIINTAKAAFILNSTKTFDF